MMESSERDALVILQELKHSGYVSHCERVDTIDSLTAAIPKKHWDVIICRYTMPRFCGLAAIRVVRDVGLDIPVVIVSDADGEETAGAAIKAGAADFISIREVGRLGAAVQRELREVRERRDRRRAEAALRRTEVELDEMQKGLVQSEKLAALGRFSSGIAHELKNPLGIVLGGIEFLEVKTKRGDPDVRTAVSKIKEAALRAAQIVDDILKFAKPSDLKLDLVDPNELVKDALSLFQYGIKSREIEIRADFAKESMRVKVDRNRIEQVLFNLFANAVESLEGQGSVHVGVMKRPRSTAFPHGACVIEVTDTGVGISPENLRRLFEPFFTTKRDQQGTGLGLFIAKNIVSHHNGDLKIESQAGKGTKAQVILQLAE